MAKNKKPQPIMSDRSVPYALRVQMEQQAKAEIAREEASRKILGISLRVLHREYSIGYERLMNVSLKLRSIADEFYSDEEVGRYHLSERISQIGDIPAIGESDKAYDYRGGAILSAEKERFYIYDNMADATANAMRFLYVALNDVLRFGHDRMNSVCQMVLQDLREYNKNPVAARKELYEYLERIGFEFSPSGEICGRIDSDTGKVVPAATVKKWKEQWKREELKQETKWNFRKAKR